MSAAQDDKPANAPKRESSEREPTPSPSEVLTILLDWLRHYWDAPRQKSKWTEVAMIVLTLLIAAAAFWSALVFQGQLTEARRATNLTSESFRIDERAWIEIEPIKPALLSQDAKFGATFTCDIYPKNAGKTVARDIVVNAHDLGAMENFGNDAAALRSTQEKMLLGKFTEMGSNKPVILPSNPVPKVLAPNSVSPVPFRLTCQEPQRFANGHQFIHYLVGRIDYCDQFQVKHWLKFCFFVVNARSEVWACQEGNDEDRNTETPTPETTCGKAN